MLRIVSLSALLVCSVVIAADAPAPSPEEQRVMQVTQDACVAFLTGDLEAAEPVLGPGCTLANSSAVVQTREEVLSEIRNRYPVYTEFRNHSRTARVFGNAAIVQGITSVKGTSGGHAFDV